MMRVLLTTDVIHAGGAETFVLRLSQALNDRGHEVVIYPLYKNRVDMKVAKAIAPNVYIKPAKLSFIRFLQIIDGILRRLRIDFSIINFLLVRDLIAFCKKQRIDIIHSHLFTADLVAVKSAKRLKIPVVTTIHGDYKNYSRKIEQNVAIPFVNFKKKLAYLLKNLHAIVYISDEQLQFFKRLPEFPNLSLHKIYNGYEVSENYRSLTRKELQLPNDSFIYGMVARGIPEKGWEVVINAFCQLQQDNAYLMLIGDSEYVQSLKQKYKWHNKILFMGYSSNPIEFIKLFNIGLFASTYYSESLPTVLIEYFSCGVPVVTVDIAECKNMLRSESGEAGLLVSLQGGKVPVLHFAKAMNTIAENRELYNRLKENTNSALKKFNMAACINSYEEVYKSALINREGV